MTTGRVSHRGWHAYLPAEEFAVVPEDSLDELRARLGSFASVGLRRSVELCARAIRAVSDDDEPSYARPALRLLVYTGERHLVVRAVNPDDLDTIRAYIHSAERGGDDEPTNGEALVRAVRFVIESAADGEPRLAPAAEPPSPPVRWIDPELPDLASPEEVRPVVQAVLVRLQALA